MADTVAWLAENAALKAEVERLVAGQSLMLDDLAALLRAVGLGDHARPETPHHVMQEAIAEARHQNAILVRLAMWIAEDENQWVTRGDVRYVLAAAQPEEKP